MGLPILKCFALLGLSLTILLAACSGFEGSDSPTRATLAPEALWSSAQSNLRDLRNFRARVSVAESHPYWEVESDEPRYHVVYHLDLKGDTHACSSTPTPLASPIFGCGPLTPNGASVLEAIRSPDFLFFRGCSETASVCEPWQKNQDPAFPRTGPAPAYLPQFWPAAVNVAKQVNAVGVESLNGVSVTHFHGLLNPITARIQADTTVGTYGVSEPIEGLRNEERRYEADPAEIDVWVSNSDSNVVRIDLLTTFEDPAMGRGTVSIEYLQLGGVKIQQPETS